MFINQILNVHLNSINSFLLRNHILIILIIVLCIKLFDIFVKLIHKFDDNILMVLKD